MPQLFLIFLNILLPVFSLVLIGYWTGPKLALEARSLSRLAYFILTPAFIFNQFSSAHVRLDLAARMAAFMIAITLLGVVIAVIVAKLLRVQGQMLAAYVLISAFGNVGNFGLPIIQFKFGDEALFAASFYFLVGVTVGFIIGVTAASWHKGSGLGAVRTAFTTPSLLAVAPALAINLLDLPVPLFVDRSIGLLAAAMVPVMLVTLGVQLADMDAPKLVAKLWDVDVMVVSALRLLVGPLLALALAGYFGLGGVERGAGIIQASMPAAVLTSLIALEHKLLPEFVTTTVLFSTLASALTLTLVLALV